MQLSEQQKRNIIIKGAAYERLTRYPEWATFEADIREIIEQKKNAVIFDLVNDRMEDRAICWGLRMSLDLPTNTMNEAAQLKAEDEQAQFLHNGAQ